jgi:hypothetical protein
MVHTTQVQRRALLANFEADDAKANNLNFLVVPQAMSAKEELGGYHPTTAVWAEAGGHEGKECIALADEQVRRSHLPLHPV